MTVQIDKEAPLPEYASYSAITSYLACGWAYYLGRMLKLTGPESVWSVGGSAFHLAAENYDRTTV